MTNRLLSVSLLVSSLTLVIGSDAAGQVTAAPSGIPGDGIPDLYFFLQDDVAPNGRFGEAGILQLDTDGTDFSALLVSDADAHLFNGCICCDGCGPTWPPPGHFYTVGNINDATQWVRTFPLSGPGMIGIFELAMGPTLPPSYFIPLFDDQNTEDIWQFRYATDSSGQFFSNITFVPEPHFGLLSLLTMAWMARRANRRRQPVGGNAAGRADAVTDVGIFRCTHPAPHGAVHLFS